MRRNKPTSASTSIPASKLDQFCRVAGTTSSVAMEFLKKHKGQLEPALDAYFYSQQSNSLPIDYPGKTKQSLQVDAITSIFDAYKDSSSNVINMEGLSRLCQDIQFDPDDPVLFAFAYHCESPSMCEFTKQGFIQGLLHLNVDSIPKLKQALNSCKEKLQHDPSYFKSIYDFVFIYSRDSGQKSLALETAITLWEILLADKFTLLPKWIEFLRTQYQKPIPKDTWQLLYEFTKLSSLNDYDPYGAWPSVIDDFVEYLHKS